MGRRLPRTKVTPTGMKVLLWGIVVLIVMTLLGMLNIVPSITEYTQDVLTLIAIFFVFTEIGLMQVIQKRKKLKGLAIFGATVGILAFVSLILGWLGVTVAFLESAKIFVHVGLLIYVVIEIFK